MTSPTSNKHDRRPNEDDNRQRPLKPTCRSAGGEEDQQHDGEEDRDDGDNSDRSCQPTSTELMP